METKPNDKNPGDAANEESISGDKQPSENQSPNPKKEKEFNKRTKGRGRLWLIAAGILIVLSATGISLASCSKSKTIEAQTQAELEFKYAMLEASWNQYAKNYPAQFRLFGERGGSDTNIIKALEHWLSAFSAQSDSNYLEELNRLRNVYGITTFHAWDDFRREHHRQKELALNTGMSPTALCEAINNYIGLARSQNPQDYISAETVKTIVYMNNICAFFEGKKDELHKEGIDTEISECSKLDPGVKFPILQNALNN